MNIRLETPEDYREVEELTREAFNEFEATFRQFLQFSKDDSLFLYLQNMS